MDPVAIVFAVLTFGLAVAYVLLMQRQSALHSSLAVSLSKVETMEEQLSTEVERAKTEADIELRRRLVDAREELDDEEAGRCNGPPMPPMPQMVPCSQNLEECLPLDGPNNLSEQHIPRASREEETTKIRYENQEYI